MFVSSSDRLALVVERSGSQTLAGGILPGNAGSALLLLPKQASNGGLDALLLGRFVEGVLAAIAAAGVAALAVQQTPQPAQVTF